MAIRKFKINIGASSDHFGAFATNCEGIYGSGSSVAEAKADIIESIERMVKGEYSIEWHYDVQSLLKYYQGVFSNAALERLTGINQKQLWNYANGVSVSREKSKKKRESALH